MMLQEQARSNVGHPSIHIFTGLAWAAGAALLRAIRRETVPSSKSVDVDGDVW